MEQDRCLGDVLLAAVKVITTMFPNVDIAMNAERILCGSALLPAILLKVNWKNCCATLSFGFSWSDFGTTIILGMVSLRSSAPPKRLGPYV
jgi:hypothetical protein